MIGFIIGIILGIAIGFIAEPLIKKLLPKKVQEKLEGSAFLWRRKNSRRDQELQFQTPNDTGYA